MWKFEEGAHRFDLKTDELDAVHFRMPGGNELGAFQLIGYRAGKH